MPKIIRNEIEYSSTTSTANQISYLNTTSGLSATNVQGAIDEVVGDIPVNATELPISSSDSTSVADKISSIIESGSNANGSYIKYADGTMICTKSVTCSIPSNGWAVWGSCYDTVDKYSFGNFPQTYYVTPKIMATITAGNAWLEGVWSTSTTSAGECRFIRPNDGAQKNITVDIIAIGRWKA